MEKKFKPGDEVIALTSANNKSLQFRIKGEKYIITKIAYCSGCGRQRVNLENNLTKNPTIRCGCNNIGHTGGYKWTYSKYFVKADKESITQEELNAVNEEDFERAILLRDLKL